MKNFYQSSLKAVSVLVVLTIFLGSFFLGVKVRAKELGIKTYDIGSTSSLPVLTGNNLSPDFTAEGIIAVDSKSNVTLFEKNADEKLYPASTTKIITALVSLDYYRLDQVLTVENPYVDGQKMGLVPGEQMNFENLLNGLLIYSANDAAVTLADNYPGGRDTFVAAMNAKAASLHLENSHLANPIGLDDPTQYTTSRDMVRVAEIAMQNPEFASVVGTKERNITDVTGKLTYDVKNVNQLLGSVDGVIGVKTGWTEGARENLITNVDRNGENIFIALLGSQDRFGETTTLINWVYGNYTWKKVGFAQQAVSMLLK